MTALDRQICSELVYAAFLGFRANLANFHNPVAGRFAGPDYETFLRRHVMQILPQQAKAEKTANAILRAQEEILAPYEEAILSCYVHPEITGPKLAHLCGYRFANQFLLWVEPGYVSDGAQTGIYAMELYRDLGFRVGS